jgi:Flp pilus assembly protein TadG
MKNYTRSGWIRLAGSQRGVAAVEFALICSLLFLLVFGIIEFSIMLYDKAMLTNASREGARAGIVWAPDRTEASVTSLVTAAVDLYTPNLINFDATSLISTDVDFEGVGPGQSLTVNLTYPYSFLVFDALSNLFGGGFGPILNLQAQTVMRME